MLALPVFAIAFVQYIQYVIPIGGYGAIIIKGLFIASLTGINIFGVKAAGRVNDLLTKIKLIPLMLLIIAGFAYLINYPSIFIQNYSPFAPLGFDQFGTALVNRILGVCRVRIRDTPSSGSKKSPANYS